MPLAKFTKTVKGSPNGIKVVTYIAGEEYDIPAGLYASFSKQGVLKGAVEPTVEPAKPEAKEIDLPSFTKAELVDFAKQELGLEIDGSNRKDDLIEEIRLFLEKD